MSTLRLLFVHPWALALPAVLLPLGVLALLARIRRRRALARLGNPLTLGPLLSVQSGLRALRGVCFVWGLVWLSAGIAGPRWGRDEERSVALGRDLVVALDVSPSMLAEAPSRLKRAKAALNDLSWTVQKRGGHRLALVLFAGRAKIVCPLTHDYDHFRDALDDIDETRTPADLLPSDQDVREPRGRKRYGLSGTRIGEGLIEAVTAHDARFEGIHQDILLISDGDDPANDGEWEEGIEVARKYSIPVHVVGVGDPETGSPIPLPNKEEWLEYDGEIVLTTLREEPLREIYRRTNGTYTPAKTRSLRLGELFRERIEPGTVRETEEDRLPLPKQRYPWFLATALVLLTTAAIIGDQPRPRRSRPPRPPAKQEVGP